ncbi:ribose transport system permease protein RbsC [Peptococcaceae bacterium CEB3]|nr:ribose transport system permease protein RbsC [Peptococcaceae bacterium CEB3]
MVNGEKSGVLEAIRRSGLQKLLALGALLIMCTFFSIFGQNFFSHSAFMNILDASYYIGFMAIGQTFVIITGGIDLSVGTVMMSGALIGGVAYNVWHWPIAFCLVVIVIVATIFGLINGLLIAKLHLPPFIVTLGTQFISLGFGSIVAEVQTQQYPTVNQADGWFKTAFYRTQGGFPMGAVFLLLFFIAAYILLTRTKLGRYTYAIGSNEEAARISGINIDKWKVIVYVLSGFSAGLAGILYAATYTTIVPQTGNGLELYAIAAVVIGGTSLAGGVGSLVGSLIGVFIMTVLKDGLMSMNMQSQWQIFFTGVVVILAVLLDIYRSKKAAQVKN